ncbi:hypothetical protein AB0E69_28310 [Kribbella sp. NPDC026611]|uniref:hypothetical protein n=1 Tax=Kribbella sp. NPDC026611 TaxID=3154911 RepID=UPI0033C4C957
MPRVHELESAAVAIVRAQFEYLVRRYGTDNRFRDGWASHNATHNLRVAWHAARGAARLVETGAAPPDSVAYALIAGIHHDHVQEAGGAYDLNPQRALLSQLDERQATLQPARPLTYTLTPERERLSVVAAHQAMREYEQQHGYQPMELFTQDGYGTVDELIMATQVVAIDKETGIITGATAERPVAAAVSDADKSDLSLQGGLHRGLNLLTERNRESLAVPAFSDGSDLDVRRDVSMPFLESQIDIHGRHRYTLPQSDELFPQRAFNLDQLHLLLRELTAHRMSWRDLTAHTRHLAATEPIPQRASAVVRDPQDLIGDLRAGLRGEAPAVLPTRPVPAELQTDRDRQGIPYEAAVFLAANETAVLPKPKSGGIGRI